MVNDDEYVDAESRAAVSHVEPQSHGGSATDPTGPADSGCRGSCTDTHVSINTQKKHTHGTRQPEDYSQDGLLSA